MVVNKLRHRLDRDEWRITVVDQDDGHIYQPGLLFVPFGLKRAEDLQRSRREQLHAGIAYHQSAIDRVEISDDRVVLSDGTELSYDVLIIATGAILVPDETEGLTGHRLERHCLHVLLAGGRGGIEAEARRVLRQDAWW